jgi:hypothetical protein
MQFVCRENQGKNTDTPSEYLIFTAFPRQQRLRECALSIASYAHCLSRSCSSDVLPLTCSANKCQRNSKILNVQLLINPLNTVRICFI